MKRFWHCRVPLFAGRLSKDKGAHLANGTAYQLIWEKCNFGTDVLLVVESVLRALACNISLSEV